MANLEVARVCNLQCPFCFAQTYMGNATSSYRENFISIQKFQQHLDFLDRSNIDQVRFIGGEPTLHPEFPALVQLARERMKTIAVFSNGLIPVRARQALAQIDPEHCIVLINSSASRKDGQLSVRDRQRRLETVRALGSRVMLGYTIFTTDFDMGDVIAMASATDCRKVIRVGLAHPGTPDYAWAIHPNQYKHIGQRMFEYAGLAFEEGIRMEFDCGFVRCMFTDEQVQTLRSQGSAVGWNCSPVLDVHISGTIIMCFPNDGLVDMEITPDCTAQQVREQMIARTAIYRNVGIFAECAICRFKQEQTCSGGGLEHIIQRFRHSRFQIEVPT